MKDYRSTVIETAYAQLAEANGFIWLLEIRVPSTPPTRLRLTNWSQQVPRGTDSGGNAIIWYPFPIAFGELREQKKGNLDEVTISVANCTRELMASIELYDGLADQPVVIRLVHSQALADPAAERRFDGKVSRCRVTADVASFVVSATNLTKRLFPRDRILAFDCIHKNRGGFGGTGCGYRIPVGPTNEVGGGFSFCGGTLEDCEERGADEAARSLTVEHPLRYGGCPGTRQGAS